MIITPQQDQALKAVSAWYKDSHSTPFFYLGGYAGTGKCLGKGTPVLMYDGSIKKVEDINVGGFCNNIDHGG